MTHLYKKLGLSDFEYSEIVKRLKRIPNETELYLFSAMWSEHCGYKHSKRYLKELPNKNSVCSDENAGGIEIGTHVIFFKTESHNHPSAVEPFQGAATGIGGIIRDILTLGARPIALLDSLKFGDLKKGKNKYLLDGVVKGISTYGNSIGVPTIGGETTFYDCFSDSPLVNVLAVGLIEKNKIKKSIAKPNGVVILLGSYTGRDGIHGASFASKELENEKSDNKLSVQLADPFMKKNVIEASLEILNSDDIIASQDCGAAGLLSSTSEMAFKGNCGMEIHLDKVHLREANMLPWEIMLSESQERMVFIVKEDYKKEVFKIAEKYAVPVSEIGKTIEENVYRLYFKGKKEAEINPATLNDCITYELDEAPPFYINEYRNKVLEKTELKQEDIRKILKSPNISSKKYIYSQYDYMVGNRTLSKPEKTSANGLWIQEENKFIAFTMDSKPQVCFLNPFEGVKHCVYEAYRNLISSGFKPRGITDCLNFASPENKDTAYQFVQTIKGMKQACIELNIPVVSGNVSFYNENKDGKIYPTPVIGMMGESDTNIFKNTAQSGDYVYLIGNDIKEDSKIGGSLYHNIFYNFLGGEIEKIDSYFEIKLGNFILDLQQENQITACNDVSKGGIFISLFEILHTANCGFKGNLINLKDFQKSLFGEIPAQYIICSKNKLENIFIKKEIPYRFLGKLQKENLEFNNFSFNIKELFKIYETSFELELTT